jgi:hypothetical protein
MARFDRQQALVAEAVRNGALHNLGAFRRASVFFRDMPPQRTRRLSPLLSRI